MIEGVADRSELIPRVWGVTGSLPPPHDLTLAFSRYGEPEYSAGPSQLGCGILSCRNWYWVPHYPATCLHASGRRKEIHRPDYLPWMAFTAPTAPRTR